MPDAPVLNKFVADELIGHSSTFRWPKDKPEVRESWVRAVERDPDILRREANTYKESVTFFFYNLSDLGNSMARLWDDGSLPDTFRSVKNDIRKYNDNDRELRKTLARIKAILNVSGPERAGRNDLLRIARSYLFCAEGHHDVSNLLSSIALWGDGVGKAEREKAEQIGRHLADVGNGGANMMVYGPISHESSFQYRFARKLKDFFEQVRKGALQIEYAGDDVHIHVDEPNVYRCCYNLASNAINRGKASRLRISAIQTGPDINIEFSDNGNGLPREEGIFDYGASYSGGQGLGLFLTKQIIEAHGGAITAVAHNNDPVYKGALFNMKLPIKQNGPIDYPNYF